MKEIEFKVKYGDFTTDFLEIKSITFSDDSQNIDKVEGQLKGYQLSIPTNRIFTYYRGILKLANHLKLKDYQNDDLKSRIIDACENVMNIEPWFKAVVNNPKVYTALCFIIGLLIIVAWFK